MRGIKKKEMHEMEMWCTCRIGRAEDHGWLGVLF